MTVFPRVEYAARIKRVKQRMAGLPQPISIRLHDAADDKELLRIEVGQGAKDQLQ